MANDVARKSDGTGKLLRTAAWSGAALLLLLPLIAMQFTSEVDWDETDFIVMGIMLFGAAGAFDFATRLSGSLAYRFGAAAGIGTCFLLVWVNLAVGIIGSEDNPQNLLYLAVLATALTGALATRFRPRGMALTMAAAAALQLAIGVYGLAAGIHDFPEIGTYQVLGATGLFVLLWLVAAGLFANADRAAGQS
jgi:hypothetical protein